MVRLLLSILMAFTSSIVFAQDLPLQLLHLPSGFKIDIYAAVPRAREMALGDKHTVFVGSFEDKVYAIVPDIHSPHGSKVITIASGLNLPNGVAFLKSALYVAEIDKILRFDNIEDHLNHPPKPVVIASLPKETHHGWRFIRFGPDGKLYIAVGMPCNVCLKEDPRFGTIMRMNPDGSHLEVYVKGLRNSVGFDWDPRTKKLWFTDNGRDWLGDDLPPDKLSVAPEKGMDFGFPYYDSKNLPNPTYAKMRKNIHFTPPVLELPAHVAPLGMTIYTGNQFPEAYRHQIFIALHGSWNRSSKVGYQVITVNISAYPLSMKPFITGWLQGEKPWGRPVAILVLPDGSLLISDDYAGVIYRVTYG